MAGGLAEQLQRVIQREAADIAFWGHRVKKMSEQESTGSCLVVSVV